MVMMCDDLCVCLHAYEYESLCVCLHAYEYESLCMSMSMRIDV
jgi:hypothetical protein